MVSVPRSWRGVFHPQAARPARNQLAYRPGWRGSGMQPMRRVPIGAYTSRATSVPLTGGQNQAAVPSSGNLTLTVGPQGLGTVWYPAQITLSTTTGALDTSVALVFLGSQGVPITQVGSVFSGNGVVALAIPSVSPGQVLIVQWTGAHPGDIAALNVVGTMDALTTGSGQ